MKFLGVVFVLSFCMIITGNAGALGELVTAFGEALSNMAHAFGDGMQS